MPRFLFADAFLMRLIWRISALSLPDLPDFPDLYDLVGDTTELKCVLS